jgi:hypothetical protein
MTCPQYLIILAMFLLLKSPLNGFSKSIQASTSLYKNKFTELIFPCKDCYENGESSNSNRKKNETLSIQTSDKKLFLKDLLENEKPVSSEEKPDENPNEYNKCNVKNVEFSINLQNCGRIIINSTKCEGFCRSKTTLIPNTNTQKTFCYACKSHEFDYTTYQVKCWDGTIKSITLKTVKSCTCFKYSEKTDEITNFKIKNFL